MSDVLYVDNSALKAVARCSTEALVRYGLGWTTPSDKAALKAGTAFHACMEAHLKGADAETALQAFTDSYTEWGLEHVPLDDRLSPGNLTRILTYWLDTHPLSALPFKVDPGLVEIGFAFPLTEDIVFCGRIDAVATYNGNYYIVEHKSTGRISQDWLSTFYLDSQLSGYLWAAQQHTGLPIIGAFLNAVEFSRLPHSDKRCPKHATSYDECGHLHSNSVITLPERSEYKLDQWRKTAIHLAKKYKDLLDRFPSLEQIHKVRMQGTFNGSCRFCAFHDWCRLDRSVTYVNDNLIHDPWEPYDRSTMERDSSGHKP